MNISNMKVIRTADILTISIPIKNMNLAEIKEIEDFFKSNVSSFFSNKIQWVKNEKLSEKKVDIEK